MEVLASYGEMSEVQRQRCLKLDEFVRNLWEPIFEESPDLQIRLSLVALGGYGEGFLCPGSDIDLLFLHRDLSEEVLSKLVKTVVYPLWDQKFEVSYRVFTLEEALGFATEDPTFFTSLLSARLVCGSEVLFEELLQSFEELFYGREKEFYLRLKKFREIRLARLGEEVYFLEPHLKDGPGGLRDFQFLMWAARLIFGFSSLNDFVHAGILTPEEKKELEEAEEFLRKVREELHLLCGRKEDRLFMEYQPELAKRLGYGSADRASTERFVSDLFKSFSVIKEAVDDLTEEIEELFFSSGRQRLRLFSPSPAAEFLKGIFERQAEEGLSFDRNLKRFLRGKKWTERDLREIFKAFPELLTKPHSLTMLRSMRSTGILFKVLPEFKPLWGRVQYDVYHLYALDEHLFLTVDALHRLKKERADLFSRISDERLLYLAALLHDVAKGEPEHDIRGAERAISICSRFGLNDKEVNEVAFLVGNHLLLMDTALRRDLAEEGVIEDVVLRVESLERLSALYLLTLADAMATGPKALNTWKETLLEDLYLKASKLLKKSVSPSEIKEASKKREKLSRDFPKELVESVPLPQLETYEEEELRRVLEGVQEFIKSGSPWTWEEVLKEKLYRVFVVCKDRPGLFADLVGSLFASGFSIKRARIFTWAARFAVDEFVVEPFVDGASLRNWKEDLEKTLEAGKVSELVEKRKRSLMRLGPKNPFEYVDVRVDQEGSDFYTVVEVYAPDRPGLLFDIASVISESGCVIGKALVSEREDLVADIFYVTNREGEKLSDSEAERLSERIKNKLKEVCV